MSFHAIRVVNGEYVVGEFRGLTFTPVGPRFPATSPRAAVQYALALDTTAPRAGQDRLGLTAEVVPPVQPEASDQPFLASEVSRGGTGHTSLPTPAMGSLLVPVPPAGAGSSQPIAGVRSRRHPVEDTGL